MEQLWALNDKWNDYSFVILSAVGSLVVLGLVIHLFRRRNRSR
ncbi:hypothetical protein GCM10007416_27850 [Kroppenstedtia guangzhouensis]|uniref:LPXTG-motif cell wall anchor domain-containing protein n=1 Tax=Kroppenstedtia guangzhouensis TaxID=1274356 RepID=A0ABQ1GYV7_9BACL|nr:EYxxD motif small membrane protein [Kroppenstedtia guangzhouensis]GGA53189.1 hypothetical protein GCM10007416_27850 [Kroppenstedtia guangzhouensis]